MASRPCHHGGVSVDRFFNLQTECEGRLVAHDLRRLRGVPVLGLEDCRRGVLLVAVGLCAELGLELRLRKEETTSDSRRPRAGSAAEWPVRVHHKCCSFVGVTVPALAKEK